MTEPKLFALIPVPDCFFLFLVFPRLLRIQDESQRLVKSRLPSISCVGDRVVGDGQLHLHGGSMG